ncbi:MAG: hypothetical protein ABSC60_12155, partial [Acidobacteriota bacterium]
KIFSKAERIFPVSETMVFGIQKIFSVIEAIFPVVETTVSATESIFSEVENIFIASDNIFSATKSVFSVAEKTVGEAPAALVQMDPGFCSARLRNAEDAVDDAGIHNKGDDAHAASKSLM